MPPTPAKHGEVPRLTMNEVFHDENQGFSWQYQHNSGVS